MNDVNKYSDIYESELLINQLQLIKAKGLDVAVAYPTTASNYSIKNNNGITIIGVPRTKTTLYGVSIASNQGKLYYEIIK